MKILKGIGLIALAGAMLVSCKNSEEKPKEAESKTENVMAANAKMETASLGIEGMTCEVGCAKTIEGKLAELNGVKDAVVDFEAKVATVSFDANVQDLASLTQTIEATGGGDLYKVTQSEIVTQ